MHLKLPLRALWDDLQSSLWFRPTLFTLIAVMLAFVSTAVDQRMTPPEFLNTDANSARALLSAIASSMLTVTSLTFSIIMVALVLASQQFSPRVLRNYMSDHVSQNVLGIFIGTFVFTLLVLGRINEQEPTPFVPVFSILFSFVLTLLSVGGFIYFVHHMAKTIHVSDITMRVARHTVALLDEPLLQLDPFPQTAAAATSMQQGAAVPALHPGYVQAIDFHGLLLVAVEKDVVVRLARLVGDYVPQGALLLDVFPASALDEALCKTLYHHIDIGEERTMFQDVRFGVRQLVDIALRALSPAVNDPTTAVNCIDHLSNILIQAAQRPDPATHYQDEAGALRVITPVVTFVDLVDLSFAQVRHYAQRDLSVTVRLLQVLAEVARFTESPQRQQALWRHAAMISRGANKGIQEPLDREQVNEAIVQLAEQLGERPQALLLPVPHKNWHET